MIKLKEYDRPFGLYIHFPFCLRKCSYCDFYSIKYTQEFANKYVESLLKEIKIYSKKIPTKKIKTIYLGGGTPGLFYL